MYGTLVEVQRASKTKSCGTHQFSRTMGKLSPMCHHCSSHRDDAQQLTYIQGDICLLFTFQPYVSGLRPKGGGEGVSKYNLHGQLDSCTIHLMSERHVHANIQNEIAKHARVVGVVGQT